MSDHMIIHDVIWNVQIDDYENLQEVRLGLLRSLQDIERLLDGAHVGTVSLLIPDHLQIT